MRILAATIALVALLAVAGPASATTNPAAAATMKCTTVGSFRAALATITISGFSTQNHLTATSKVFRDGIQRAGSTVFFDGPGITFGVGARIPAGVGPFVFRVETVVTGGAGRVKATAEATVTCRGTTPPPPPLVVNPSASFWGPCGDPFYRAILNNRRSDRAVTFRVNWKPFGAPRRDIVRRVAAHQRVLTGLFDVAGSTMMFVYQVRPGTDRLLASKRSAPNRIYGTCPAGVPIIH